MHLLTDAKKKKKKKNKTIHYVKTIYTLKNFHIETETSTVIMKVEKVNNKTLLHVMKRKVHAFTSL